MNLWGLCIYVIVDSLASRLCEHCLCCVYDFLFLGSYWTKFLWVPGEENMAVFFWDITDLKILSLPSHWAEITWRIEQLGINQFPSWSWNICSIVSPSSRPLQPLILNWTQCSSLWKLSEASYLLKSWVLLDVNLLKSFALGHFNELSLWKAILCSSVTFLWVDFGG